MHGRVEGWRFGNIILENNISFQKELFPEKNEEAPFSEISLKAKTFLKKKF